MYDSNNKFLDEVLINMRILWEINFKLQSQNELNLEKLWNDELIDFNAEEEKVKQIQFIENPKITTGQQAIKLNQLLKNNQIQISPKP
ncbi:unnamed protein product [Paramecium pentaurelia]|uniref:Uncharacterized protein n=1 Tax=Paramecium pentaurelia TaxID=43138 RepID=A0A8S1YIL6_9CILI|nr:unnamed protein product [Paramecium pentaurelia]